MLITFNLGYSVSVVTAQQQNNQVVAPVDEGIFSQVSINWDVIIPVAIIAVIIGILVTIIFMIVGKIVKKIKSARRQKEDLEFYKYSLDLKNAFMNKNSKYKYKSFWTLFLLFKKAKIYARTSRGKKFIGFYEGEIIKKEGFYVLAVELRYTFFKREIDLVIFPYELSEGLIFYNDDGTIDLEVEGIDEVLSSELFSLPVFKNVKDAEKKKIFVDFSDRVYKDYFKLFGDRKAHIDTLKDSAVKIREATEMNPQVPLKRKTGNDLQN